MSWQAGDLALCVRGRGPLDGRERAPDECSSVISMLFPRVGSEWRVTHIEVRSFPAHDGNLVYLGLAGQPSDCIYDARCFRKIEAHAADAEDEEVIRLLTRQPERVE